MFLFWVLLSVSWPFQKSVKNVIFQSKKPKFGVFCSSDICVEALVLHFILSHNLIWIFLLVVYIWVTGLGTCLWWVRPPLTSSKTTIHQISQKKMKQDQTKATQQTRFWPYNNKKNDESYSSHLTKPIYDLLLGDYCRIFRVISLQDKLLKNWFLGLNIFYLKCDWIFLLVLTYKL